MSTYLQVQDRINNDYLNRTDFVAETKRHIQAAIRHFERERWDFNQTSTALTTSSSLSYVTLPSNFLILDDLRITLNGEDLPLLRQTPQWVRDMNTASTYGQPTDYAIYQRRIETFPIADSAYSLPIYYLKSLDVLSADIATNAWIQGGMEDVIVYHATKLLWANVLRNDREATKYALLERDALTTMLGYREQFILTGIKPTRF